MALTTFNPIGIPIWQTYETDTRKTISIATWNNETKYMHAEPYNGVASFLLNGCLGYIFNSTTEVVDENAPILLYDHNISGQIELDGVTAWILRGTTTPKINELLTDLPVRVYNGYPRPTALVTTNGLSNHLRVRANGEVYNRVIKRDVLVIDLGGVDVLYLGSLNVRTGIFTAKYTWEKEVLDAPEHPFYLRWINKYGGYDYWMFANKQRAVNKLESIATYDIYGTQGQKGVHSHELSNQVTISTGNVSKEEYKALCYLLQSPQVVWYDEEAKEWIPVTPQKSAKTQWDSDQAIGEIQFTFDLPTPQIVI